MPHNRPMRVKASVAAALTALVAAAGLAAGSSAAAAAPAWVRSDASWIRQAQLPDGAIEPVPGDNQILPYQANYAALGLARAAAELGDQADSNAAWRWLTWYQAHQDASGFVTDYTVSGADEVSTHTYDSTDAYAGTFLVAVAATWQADPDQARLKSLAHGIAQAVAAITATQTADGLTWAQAGYHEKLLMDNAEAYGGLRAAQLLATTLAEPALAAHSAAAARRLAAGVASLWNPMPAASTGSGPPPDPVPRRPGRSCIRTPWRTSGPSRVRPGHPAQAARIMSNLRPMQARWAEPDQTAPIDINGVVTSRAIGYWPQVGWALTVTGQPSRALDAAATMSAAARERAWPFTTSDAGALIATQSGWPATAPWVAPPPGAGFPVGLVAGLVLGVAAAVVAAVLVLRARRKRTQPRRWRPPPGSPPPGQPFPGWPPGWRAVRLPGRQPPAVRS